MYGGSEDEMAPGKKGERSDKPLSNDPMQLQQLQDEEYNNTRDTLWERLPVGKSIDDITTPQAILDAVIGGFSSLSKSFAKPATPASTKNWIKVANNADLCKLYKLADEIDYLISNVYTP